MPSLSKFLYITYMGLSTINLSANNHKIYEKFPLDVNELEASKKLKFDVSDVSFLWKAFIDFELNSDLIKVTDLIKPKGTVAENTVSSQLFVEINKFLKMDPSTGEGGTAHFNPVTRKNELVDIFTDSLAVTHKDSVIDELHVHSVRFDNCAPKPSESGHTTRIKPIILTFPNGTNGKAKLELKKDVEAPCLPQMRLVAQAGRTDSAVHLIYTFSKDPINFFSGKKEGDHELFRNIIRDLQVLKQKGPKKNGKPATDGAPLGVHPGLQQEGTRFSQELVEMVKFYAQPKYLTSIALLSTNEFDGGSDWVFAVLDVDQKNPNKLNLKPLINIKNTKGQVGPLSIGFAILENLENVYPISQVPATKLDADNVQDKRIIGKVLNPNQSSVLGMDCLSCHVATHNFFQMQSEASSRSAFKRITRTYQSPSANYYRSRPGITAFPHPKAIQFPDINGRFSEKVEPQDFANFHNFGTFSGDPSVSLRTVYESSEVAAALNRAVHGDVRGPGKDCSTTSGGKQTEFINKTFELIRDVSLNTTGNHKIITCTN